MRAFIAIELSAAARVSIAKIQEEWKASLPSARWVRPENLHLTLRFLGEVQPEVAAALGETLRSAAASAKPFTYSLQGGGCFPSVRRARVAWVGVEPVPEELVQLHHAVEAAAQEQGFSKEKRRFEPHLTIARLKSPERSVAELVATLEGRAFGDSDVSELVLFRSTLSPQGATHDPVERFPLGPSGGSP